jgi:hypothetical protein
VKRRDDADADCGDCIVWRIRQDRLKHITGGTHEGEDQLKDGTRQKYVRIKKMIAVQRSPV